MFCRFFSVKTNTNVDSRNNQFVPFSLSDFSTLNDYGYFDLTTGIFTVKTAGTYQLSLNVLVRNCKYWYTRHLFEFQVDGEKKALLPYNIGQSSEADKNYESIHLSALLRLSSGDWGEGRGFPGQWVQQWILRYEQASALRQFFLEFFLLFNYCNPSNLLLLLSSCVCDVTLYPREMNTD